MMGWNPHKIIGIVLIGLALLQPLLGIAGKFFFSKKKKDSEIFRFLVVNTSKSNVYCQSI